MIRIVLLVLISATSWCKNLEKNNPGDTSTTHFINAGKCKLSRPSAYKENSFQFRGASIRKSFPTSRNNPGDTSIAHLVTAGHNRVVHRTHKYKEESFEIAGMSTGGWFPRGNNQILGPHPTLGFVYGMGSGRWVVEAVFEGRFGPARNNYQVLNNNKLYKTHQYSGSYVGLQFGYEVARFRTSSIHVLGGLGVDSFESINPNPNDQNSESLEFNFFNANTGIGIQHFGKNDLYWSIDVIDNMAQYWIPGGTPLNGDALTIRLTIAGVDRSRQHTHKSHRF